MATNTSQKKGLDETLSIPVNHKDSAAITTRAFDSHLRNINNNMISCGKNIGILHNKIQSIDEMSKDVTGLKSQVNNLEAATSTHTRLLTDIFELLSHMKSGKGVETDGGDISLPETVLESIPEVVPEVLEPILGTIPDKKTPRKSKTTDSKSKKTKTNKPVLKKKLSKVVKTVVEPEASIEDVADVVVEPTEPTEPEKPAKDDDFEFELDD